jgi:hypothetical protein
MRLAHRAVGRVPCTLTPSLSRVHPRAVDRMSFCGRGGTRSAGPWPRGTNLKICSGRDGGMGCALHTARWGVSLVPSPHPSPASTRVRLIGCRFAGEGARARRGRGLAIDLIHQPPRGGWGLAACGRERREQKVERRGLRRGPVAGLVPSCQQAPQNRPLRGAPKPARGLL